MPFYDGIFSVMQMLHRMFKLTTFSHSAQAHRLAMYGYNPLLFIILFSVGYWVADNAAIYIIGVGITHLIHSLPPSIKHCAQVCRFLEW